MKLAGIRIHVRGSVLQQPFAFSQGWVRQRCATLVELATDEGLVGWGETARLATDTQQHLANGFRLMKLKPGCGVSDDIEVRREAVERYRIA